MSMSGPHADTGRTAAGPGVRPPSLSPLLRGGPPLPLILTITLCGLLLLALALLAGPPVALAEAPEAAEPPAPPATVKWARGWERQARKARKAYARLRICCARRYPTRVAPAPLRSASKARWTEAGRRWRTDARRWQAQHKRQLRRIKHPGGTGVDRWRPLALYARWPRRTWPKLRRTMHKESRGNPRAVNQSTRCAGLLQIHPCHRVRNVLDPLVNLRAGLRIYRARGWAPWGL